MSARPAAIVFDMDGLLFNTEALFRDAILAAAQESGHQFTEADFHKMVGRSSAINRLALQDHIGPMHNVAHFHSAWMRHYAGMKATLALKSGVMEILDRLDELELPRAICTSSSHEDVHHNLSLHGLTDRFPVVVASGDYARSKPEPAPFLRAADVLRVAPEECWALEDSHNGVRAASAAGMRTIMIPDLLPPTDEIRSLCRLIVVDLHEVRALLS